MSKILIDTFSYRWKKIDDSYYFGRTPNNDIPQFEINEKVNFLNEFITSILIHEKIIIKLDSLEELELLIGIENVIRLFNDDALEIIDDGGTMVGFLVGRDGENMLMNLSGCTGLQIESIERRLNKKLTGKIEHNKIQPLLLNVEKKKIDIDGAWIGHLVEEELAYDLGNQNLTKLLGLKADSWINIPESDMLSFMRLCYLNRSLIYQNESKADFLLAEGYAKTILQNKISPILGNHEDPNSLFFNIINDKGIPDLGKLLLNGIIKFEHIIELRNSIEGKRFRIWFKENGWDKRIVYSELMKFNSSVAANIWVKTVRWIYPKLVGLINPIAGICASAIDTFILNRYLNGWHPNFFLDDKLKKHIDNEINNHTKEINEERIHKRLGRKIGRNEKCPCGSGKKFKLCCGK